MNINILGRVSLLGLALGLSFPAVTGVAQPTPPTVWDRPAILSYIHKTAGLQGVDPALALAIADIESSFNPRAIRWERHLGTASVGLFQVLHTTAVAEFKFKGTIESLKHPKENIEIGVKYLARCQRDFGLDLRRVSCCYQAGFYAKPAFCEAHQGVQNYIVKLTSRYALWAGGGRDDGRLGVREAKSRDRRVPGSGNPNPRIVGSR